MAEKNASLTSYSADPTDAPSGFSSFAERNQKFLAIGAAILVVGGLGWTISHAVSAAKADSAADELAVAKTADQLKKVADERASTPAGPTATLLLAEQQWKDNKRDESIATLRGLLASAPQHPAIPSARASLASKLMQENKVDEAKSLFSQVASDPKSRYLAPFAQVCEGDIAKAAGNIDEATALYKQAKDSGTNPFGQLAAKHLEFVSFKMPTEIDAPPAPPATPDLPPAGLSPTPGLEGNPLLKNFNPGPADDGSPAPADPTPPEPAPPAPPEPGK